MFKPITSQNDFNALALQFYDNPACVDYKEFSIDVKRFAYFGKLVERKLSGKSEITSMHLINLVIIMYNIFGDATQHLAGYKLTGNSFQVFKDISILLSREYGEISDENKWILEGL